VKDEGEMRRGIEEKVEFDKREFKIKVKKKKKSTRQRHSRQPFARPWDHQVMCMAAP